ncbi:MAG: C10 family peptidase, partial [Victivallales bacterium]|nr:C10 family peptidase [Victivallales bacterium]
MNRTLIRFSLAMMAALVCLSIGSLKAASVDSTTAKLFVGNWLQAANNPVVADGVERTLSEPVAITAPEGDEVLGYAINLQPYGFVVVAADTLINPVVMHSAGGQYDPDPRNPLVSLILTDMAARKAATENELRAPGQNEYYAANEDAWAKYTSETRSRAAYVVQEIWVDKLTTAEWSQSEAGDLGPVYNYYTPNVSETGAISWNKPGDPRNAVSGCVATATAQTVHFFRWPQIGVGNKSNTVSVGGKENIVGESKPYTRRMRGGDGQGGAYNWDLMVNCPGVAKNDPRYQEISDENIQAIGALLYDAGVATGMSYYHTNSGESGTNFSTGAMTNYFLFAGASSGLTFQQARASLDAHRPVLVTISGFALYTPPGASNGHAIVGDGYGRMDGRWYYHLNLGWGSFWPGANAWYNIDDYFTPNDSVYKSAGVSVGNLYRQQLQTNEDMSGAIIAGRVTDANGNPVAGVKVSISKGGSLWQSMLVWDETLDGSDPYEVKSAIAASEVGDHFRNYTDANGIWFVDKVAPGDYTVNLEKDGFVFMGDAKVTVANKNIWGIGFVAVPDAVGALELQSWWLDGGILYLQFNRAVGDVLVNPACITIGGTNLGNCPVSLAADSTIVQIDVSSLSISGNLTMTAGALYYDTDGVAEEAGTYDLPIVKVAPVVEDQASGSAAETCAVTAITRNGNDFTTIANELEFLVEGSNLADITLPDFKINVTTSYDGSEGLYSRVKGTSLPATAIGEWDASSGILTVIVGNGYGFVRVDYVPADGSTPFVSGESYRVNKEAPAIISATLSTDNQYVDIIFNKPVGGVNEMDTLAGIQASADGANYFYTGTLDATSEFSLWRKGVVAVPDNKYNAAIDGDAIIGSNAIAENQARTGAFPANLQITATGVPFFGSLTFTYAKIMWADVNGDGEFTPGTDGIFVKICDEIKEGNYTDLALGSPTYSDDGLFVLGEGSFADQRFWLSNSPVLDANNSDGSCPAYNLSTLPTTLAYYSMDGTFPAPSVPYTNASEAFDILKNYLANLLTGPGNGAWLDYSEDTAATYVAGQDTVILGGTPDDATTGTAVPDELLYLDLDGSGFLSIGDFVWMDEGDGAWTKVPTAGDTVVGKVSDKAICWREPVTNEDFYIVLHQNGGTVTDAHVDAVTDKAGNPLAWASSAIRAWLAYEPKTYFDTTLPMSDHAVNSMNVPAGVETIEVRPYANSVLDAEGNAAPNNSSTGELVLYSSGNPFIVDATLAFDNYSVAVRFSERVYGSSAGMSAKDFQAIVAEDGADATTWANGSEDMHATTRNFSADCITATVIYNDNSTEELQLTQEGENRAIRYKTGTAFLVVDFATKLDLDFNLPLLDPVYQSVANGRVPATIKLDFNNISDAEGFPLATTSIAFPVHGQYSSDMVSSLPPPMFTNAIDAYTFITAAD